MSDKKLDELHKKLQEKKGILEEIEKENNLPMVAFDVFQDPTKKNRHFKMVKIKYNPDTMEAKVVGVRTLEDQGVALSMVMDRENSREYLFNKCKKE